MGHDVIYALWAFSAGAAIPVMAALNAGLGRILRNPPLATLVLFFIGLFSSLMVVIVLRPTIPDRSVLATISPGFLAGGAIAAFYIFSVTSLAPRFGVGNTVMFVVAAQLFSSAAVDVWGLFGAPIQPISSTRLLGLFLLLIGLVTAQLGANTSQHSS